MVTAAEMADYWLSVGRGAGAALVGALARPLAVTGGAGAGSAPICPLLAVALHVSTVCGGMGVLLSCLYAYSGFTV